jgi:poly(3-hydroxybutyrate) depolymerase
MSGTQAGGNATTCEGSGGAMSNGSGGVSTGGAPGSGGSATAGNMMAGGTGGSAQMDAGPVPAKPSMGCNKPAGQALAQYVKHTIMSSNVSRDVHVWLPTGYDPKRAYRTIVALHPCGGSGNPTSNIPIQNESKGDAIILAGNSTAVCWNSQERNSPDVVYFDDMMKFAEDNYCIDEARVFAMGYSSGSWMATLLGCERADVLRGQAQVSGGISLGVQPANCKGKIAALFIHDTQDPNNTINGGRAARDRLIHRDECDATSSPWAPSPCAQYDNCTSGYPVVWCETTGKGHDRQDTLSVPAMWKFFSQF